MKNNRFAKFSLLICSIFILFNAVSAQINSAPIKSREISDGDGIPVLMKHLPDWENARNRASYILNRDDLQNALGNQPVFDAVEFQSGTEAVTAPYEQGKLLIVEFSTPQASVDADAKIQQKLAQNGNSSPIYYRRIGNYNVFLFDGSDENAANTLFDQIKYEKNVQWLGEDPFYYKRAERTLARGLSEVFIATVLWIVGSLGLAVLAGIGAGFLFYRWREQKRGAMKEFSDAGGMTRLNLDGFTPSPDRLLEE